MSDPNNHEPVEPTKPEALSPEALAIFAKARRSFGISIGILLLGFMAIGFALVYRAVRTSPPAEMVANLELPAGADVLSAVVADGALNVTYRADGIVHLRLYNQASGEITRDVIFSNEP